MTNCCVGNVSRGMGMLNVTVNLWVLHDELLRRECIERNGYIKLNVTVNLGVLHDELLRRECIERNGHVKCYC